MALSSRIIVFSDSSWHAKPMFTAVSANPASLHALRLSEVPHMHPETPSTTEPWSVCPLCLLPPPTHLPAGCSDWSRVTVCHNRAGQSEVAPGQGRAAALESLTRLRMCKVLGRWDEGQDPETHNTLSKQENVKFI